MKQLLILLAIVPTTMQVAQAPICFKPKQSITDSAQEKCLATMIYGEARGESERGQVAVAYTALNRAVKSTLCSVVLAPKQYSIFNNNPALRAAAMSPHLEPTQKGVIDKASWAKALTVARAVMRGHVSDPTNGATNYLAPVLMKKKKYTYPKWSKQYRLVAKIDSHLFYKPVDKSVTVAYN